MLNKLILLPLFLILYTTVLGQNNIGLFDQCNYSGKKVYLNPGSYKGYQLQIGNDKLSSIQIPDGMRVTIYEHDNFKGRSATYTTNTACLGEG